ATYHLSDHIRRSAHDRKVRLVGNRAVICQPVDLIERGCGAEFGHHDLHLVRLITTGGEDRAQYLRVRVGQPAARHLSPRIAITAEVGVPYPGLSQVLELVVAADGSESNAIVDLAHLVECLRSVLSNEQDAVDVMEDYHRTTTGDALACVIGPILHLLLGRDVERDAHRSVLLGKWGSRSVG